MSMPYDTVWQPNMGIKKNCSIFLTQIVIVQIHACLPAYQMLNPVYM